MSKRMAPMLHHHVSMPCTKTYFTLEEMKQGQAELSALLAVAKAARKYLDAYESCIQDPAMRHDRFGVKRALARLERASGEGR